LITSDKNVGGKKNSYRTMKACRGKYMAFCEGDDYWHHPYKLVVRQLYSATYLDNNLINGHKSNHHWGIFKN
jgi:hypothetical protein